MYNLFPRLRSVLWLGYFFMLAPLIYVIVFSFNDSRFVSVWSGFSLKWYHHLWNNKVLMKATVISLQVAFLSASIAVLLGTIAAVTYTRFPQMRGRGFFSFISIAPMVLPEVVLGMAFLMAYLVLQDWVGLPRNRGMLTIIIAHATIGMAYAFIMIRNRLKNFDSAVIEAAMDLGATPLSIFFKITIPIIAPTLISAWLLVFILSFDDLVVASFVSGAEVTTLPMAIFSSIKFGLTPEINALATVMIVILSLALLLISRKLTQKDESGITLQPPTE